MRDDRLRYAAGLVLLTALALGLLLWNIGAGSVDITLGEIAGSIRAMSGIIWAIRLPRVAAAAILGGALSVSGFLLQTFFANPIAGPFVLGISSGAKLTVSLVMVGFLSRGIVISSMSMVAGAFATSAPPSPTLWSHSPTTPISSTSITGLWAASPAPPGRT